MAKPVVPSFTYTPAQIESTCDESKTKLTKEIDAIAQLPLEKATFEKVALPFEKALTDFNNLTAPPLFMKYVSTNAALREVADKCELSTQKYLVDLFAREDLYARMRAVPAKSLPYELRHLLDEFLIQFKRNGLELPLEKRKVYVEKKKKLAELETLFNKNLVEWKEFLEVTEEELKGVPQGYRDSLVKLPNGKFKITLDYPHYFPFLENAESDDARRRLEHAFNNRGGDTNRQLLEQAIALRHEMANLLGFATHADFVLDRRMAKNPKAVAGFLERIGAKLKVRGKKDLEELLELKREALKDPKISEMRSWDWRYYENILKKKKYQIDTEKLKEYFPLPVVLKGMFDIYQTLLGVRFVEEKPKDGWHENIQFFSVHEGKKTAAYFYMDLFPREAKYSHAAAFTLQSGYRKEDGSYALPVSSIVANFHPPTKDKPALLEHSEVETLFHEFGHIMHQVLTKARFATFSGTSVKTDFVEAPSQMLENWVWRKEALVKLSQHYKTKKPLPDEWIDRLVGAKLANVGVRYLRQLTYATVDLEFHTHAQVESTALFCKITKETMGIPCQEGTQPQSGFGHVMGGYDAGYYGYLWSKVYAQDMFSRFEEKGLLDPKIGVAYRKGILEPGGEIEPSELIQKFLGREPNEKAFFKSLGVE